MPSTPHDRSLIVALTMVVLAILVFAGYVVTVLHSAPMLIAGVIAASAGLLGAAAGLVRAMRGGR